MKKHLLILLVVLALSLMSVGLAAAGDGTDLKAVSTGAVTVYASPDMTSDVVTELAAWSEVMILGTDETGAFLHVETADGAGYAPVDSFAVLNLPLLAPKVYVATGSAGATSLFATPRLGVDFVTALDDGTVGTVLGTWAEWAYVSTSAGTGWSIATDWEALPDGSQQAFVSLGSSPELGVFVEATVGSELVTTVPDGSIVWLMGVAEDEFVEVLLDDGSMGYAIASNFEMMPMTMIDAHPGSQSEAALYDAPDFGANVLTSLEVGTPVTYVAAVDDFWAEVYHPSYGTAYALIEKFSGVYTTATNVTEGAIVRSGPNDNLYNAIAVLPAGTPVIVKGVSESGAWVEVSIPFDQVTYAYNGVSGWMRDFLFADALGNTDLDAIMLAVTE